MQNLKMFGYVLILFSSFFLFSCEEESDPEPETTASNFDIDVTVTASTLWENKIFDCKGVSNYNVQITVEGPGSYYETYTEGQTSNTDMDASKQFFGFSETGDYIIKVYIDGNYVKQKTNYVSKSNLDNDDSDEVNITVYTSDYDPCN